MTPVQCELQIVGLEFLAVHELLMQAIKDNIHSREVLTKAILSSNGKISEYKYTDHHKKQHGKEVMN